MITRLLFATTIATASLQTKTQSQNLLAEDAISTPTLNGGTGWNNSWSGGTIENGALLHNGSSQNISRDFTGLQSTFAPRPSTNGNGAYAGFYSVQYELGFNINTATSGNYGFRMFQGGNNSGGTFVGLWKNDYQNGSLTFIGSNGTDYVTAPTLASDALGNSFDVWDIRANQNTLAYNVNYLFTYDVSVLHGQNSGQYKGGTYDVQVIRLVDGVATHTLLVEDIGWRDTNSFNLPTLQNITLQNTNQKTNLFIDDVKVSTTNLMSSPVPEPGSSIFVLLGMTGFVLLRRRNAK